MSSIVHVEVPHADYDVTVGIGLLGELGARVRAVSSAKRVALVSDSTVAALYGLRVDAELARGGFEVFPLSIQPGEGSKSWLVVGELLEAMAEVGLDRTDIVVALGGGVIGDVAGFAAATYLRGIDFVQVPTSLLAQVDSSVGGKTGVDLRAGKNLAGAFKQPRAVVADVALLESLPQAEWANGFAEVVKGAFIEGEAFVSWLEHHCDELVCHDQSAVADAVSRCVRFKSRVVSSDERETGLRECLNYGHTLGHAIEKVAGYGVVSHGVAVAEGMRFAARLSVEVCGTSREFVERQDRLLDAFGLPAATMNIEANELFDAMRADKKVRAGMVRFVLPERAGSWRCCPVEDKVILQHLRAWAASKRRG
ncbi:MAG: 3-dehydroquinate synthase [Coriobacteriia bacterium]|nr:3-dehydroquinate synthase [Coriobacteriia bacterium]